MTKLNPLIKDLLNRRSMIGIVSGRRGSGKSVFGYRLAEIFHEHTGDDTFILGFPEEKRHLLPDFIYPLDPNDMGRAANTYVFVDEGALVIFSRNFQSGVNKFISQLLAVSRHYDITILVATQSFAIVDINLLRLMDFLMVRRYSYFAIRFEREEVKPLIYRAQRLIRGREYGVVYGDFVPPMFVMKNRLPSFWNEELSKVWRLALTPGRAERVVKQRLLEGLLRVNPDLTNEELARVLNTSKKAVTVMKARMKKRRRG